MTGVSLEITNDQITPAPAGVTEALGNPLTLFQEFAEYLVKSTTDRFANGRAPDGSVWAGSSPPCRSTTTARKT